MLATLRQLQEHGEAVNSGLWLMVRVPLSSRCSLTILRNPGVVIGRLPNYGAANIGCR